jgi:hypothetical protein
MTPAPSLEELIDTVRADAPGADPLGMLAQASRTAADLSQIGDKLMDHFVDQARQAGHSWSEISGVLGVSKQAAHKRFTSAGGGTPPFERFTPRARAVLGGAAAQAHALGHESVRPEHLLIAVFEPAENLSAVILADAGVTRDAVGEKLSIQPAQNPPKPSGAVPYTPEAVEVLRGAVEEAILLGHNYIGTEHLLIALYRDADAAPARALTELGAERNWTVQRARQRLAELTLGTPPTASA